MKTRRLGDILAVVSAVLYGMMPLFTKTVYASGSNPFAVVFLRMCMGTVIFFAIFRLTSKESLAVSKKEFRQLCICSLFYGVTPVLLYTAYNYMASGLATALHFVYPVLVVIGSAVLGIEKLTKKKVLCCFLCMAGILTIYEPGGELSTKGVLIALVSGIAYAAYTVYLPASDLLEMDSYKLSFWRHLLSAVLAGVFMLLLKKAVWPGNLNGWVFMLLLGLATSASSFLYQQATKLAGAQDSAMLSTFDPLTCVVIG